METLHLRPPQRLHLMNSILFFSRLKPHSLLKPFSTTRSPLLALKTSATGSRNRLELSKLNNNNNGAEAARQLKENWLNSLSCPFPRPEIPNSCDSGTKTNVRSNWVIGIDPDLSGALALLKFDDSGCSPLVVDSPHLKVLVGNKVRKRLDAKSIVQLLRSFDAPPGTTAYIEQSIPYPQDGKQGWWSGGFGYGLWIGILVASGFSVLPVPSLAWKNEFELSGSKISKDDSRRVASTLFPSLNESLKRKKDHGRAEALLIAAYGKGLKLKNSEELS